MKDCSIRREDMERIVKCPECGAESRIPELLIDMEEIKHVIWSALERGEKIGREIEELKAELMKLKEDFKVRQYTT